ncbi:MAG: hypothetical protein KDC08_04845 [Actinobacteria bacterium]|nr:hypothetical protein [Actinomycetota bacterium]
MHRGCDLDTEDEIVEMVTRQYVDVGQDDLLQPYFNFGPGFIDWRAHTRPVADYWCHVLLYAPGYDIDVIEVHRHLDSSAPSGMACGALRIVARGTRLVGSRRLSVERFVGEVGEAG